MTFLSCTLYNYFCSSCYLYVGCMRVIVRVFPAIKLVHFDTVLFTCFSIQSSTAWKLCKTVIFLHINVLLLLFVHSLLNGLLVPIFYSAHCCHFQPCTGWLYRRLCNLNHPHLKNLFTQLDVMLKGCCQLLC